MTSDRDYHTLRIYEAFLEDEGIYRCCIGKASTSARLRIISKLFKSQKGKHKLTKLFYTHKVDRVEAPILSQIDDVHIAEGTPVSMSCSVSGSPTPKVTWYKDGQQIPPSRDNQANFFKQKDFFKT